MTEAELVQTATRLGAAEVAELDGERIARAVLHRIAVEPPAPEFTLRRFAPRLAAALAVAAALLLVLRFTVGGNGGPTSPTPPTSPSSLSVLHELDDLNTVELESLLESLPPAASSAAHPDPASLEQLDSKDLERLLRSLEG